MIVVNIITDQNGEKKKRTGRYCKSVSSGNQPSSFIQISPENITLRKSKYIVVGQNSSMFQVQGIITWTPFCQTADSSKVEIIGIANSHLKILPNTVFQQSTNCAPFKHGFPVRAFYDPFPYNQVWLTCSYRPEDHGGYGGGTRGHNHSAVCPPLVCQVDSPPFSCG